MYGFFFCCIERPIIANENVISIWHRVLENDRNSIFWGKWSQFDFVVNWKNFLKIFVSPVILFLQILNMNESNNCQTTFKLWFLWQILHNMRSDWKIRKIRFFQNLFSTSKIKPWYINIFSQNEVSVPVWIFFIRIFKKKKIIFSCCRSIEKYSLFATFRIVPSFYSRSPSHTPNGKTFQAFFPAKPSATPSANPSTTPSSDMCSLASLFFMFSKLRPRSLIEKIHYFRDA